MTPRPFHPHQRPHLGVTRERGGVQQRLSERRLGLRGALEPVVLLAVAAAATAPTLLVLVLVLLVLLVLLVAARRQRAAAAPAREHAPVSRLELAREPRGLGARSPSPPRSMKRK